MLPNRLASALLAAGLVFAPISAFAQAAAPAATPKSAPIAAPAPTAPAPMAPKAPAATPVAAPANALLDINTATKEQLDVLKGIGPVRAEAIIKGRPYKGKDDLVQRGVIPASVYADIKDQIIAKQK